MSISQQKELLLNAFDEAIKELEKNNAKGFLILESTLTSLNSLFDDEEMAFMQTVIGSISYSFLNEQADLEGGDKFLKNFAEALANVAKAYRTNDMTELNKKYRKIPVLMNTRWKKGRTLKETK